MGFNLGFKGLIKVKMIYENQFMYNVALPDYTFRHCTTLALLGYSTRTDERCPYQHWSLFWEKKNAGLPISKHSLQAFYHLTRWTPSVVPRFHSITTLLHLSNWNLDYLSGKYADLKFPPTAVTVPDWRSQLLHTIISYTWNLWVKSDRKPGSRTR